MTSVAEAEQEVTRVLVICQDLAQKYGGLAFGEIRKGLEATVEAKVTEIFGKDAK